MRLIDADAFVIDAVRDKKFAICRYDVLNENIIVETVYKDLAEELKKAPTVKAVQVVRCGECEFAIKEKNMPKGYRKCVNSVYEGSKSWRSIHDFCSYGWKKGKNSWKWGGEDAVD